MDASTTVPSGCYTLERSPDGATVIFIDEALTFKEIGLGRLAWRSVEGDDDWYTLNAVDALAFEIVWPGLLLAVRMFFVLPACR